MGRPLEETVTVTVTLPDVTLYRIERHRPGTVFWFTVKDKRGDLYRFSSEIASYEVTSP